LVFEKNANFFAKNCRKSQKIVIITSTPGIGKPVFKSRYCSSAFSDQGDQKGATVFFGQFFLIRNSLQFYGTFLSHFYHGNNFDEKWAMYILGSLFTNAAGHPVADGTMNKFILESASSK
jgi:hypothetical protein